MGSSASVSEAEVVCANKGKGDAVNSNRLNMRWTWNACRLVIVVRRPFCATPVMTSGNA